jgi:hypothetical protein
MSDLIFLDYMQQHNQNPSLYESYSFNSQRNSICFNIFIIYDSKIITQQIIEKINFLKKLNFIFDKSCEIKVTPYTWYLKYSCSDKINDDIIKILINDSTLCYLEINSDVLKSELMIDFIKDEYIEYNPKSFRQSDDSIKNKIYEILEIYVSDKNICFMGGEMVFLGKLLKPTNMIFYTDFESIFNDAKLNFPDNSNIHLINYNTDKIKDEINLSDILITNTSKSGIGVNISNEILRIKYKKIIIISCNRKSFMKDYKILSKSYNIDKIFDIKTNYVVTIYFLVYKI